jgi:hypothetical protein
MKKLIFISALYSFKLLAYEFTFPEDYCKHRQEVGGYTQTFFSNDILTINETQNYHAQSELRGQESSMLTLLSDIKPEYFYVEGLKYPISEASYSTEFSPDISLSLDHIASTQGQFSKFNMLGSVIRNEYKNGKPFQTNKNFDQAHSSLIIFPQKYKPHFIEQSETIDLVLPTGEFTYFDKKSGEILNGVLDQKFVSTKDLRYPYKYHYNGSGLAIDFILNSVGSKLLNNTISVRLKNQECILKKDDLFRTSESRCLMPKMKSEDEMSKYLEERCGFGIPQL